jgi:hypothetical protein
MLRASGQRLRSIIGAETRIIERTRPWPRPLWLSVDTNLHSPERHLIELRMEHADLQASLQRLRAVRPLDELAIRRLEKRGLQLRDQIARLELVLDPKEPA